MPVFKGSRYEESRAISIDVDGIIKLDIDKGKEFDFDDLKEDDYSIYPVQRGETLESIAYKFTGRSENYYIIAQVNNIYDPFISLEGKDLIIPSKSFFINL